MRQGLAKFLAFVTAVGLAGCGDSSSNRVVEKKSVATLDISGRKSGFFEDDIATCIASTNGTLSYGVGRVDGLNIQFRKKTGETLSIVMTQSASFDSDFRVTYSVRQGDSSVVSFTDGNATYSTGLEPTAESKGGQCHIVAQSKGYSLFTPLSVQVACSNIQGTHGKVGSMVFSFDGACTARY